MSAGKAIFFPRVILYNSFLFWLIYGGLGFGVLGLGSYIGFFGSGFSVDGVWGLWCGAFWVFLGWGSIYKHKRITLGEMGRTMTHLLSSTVILVMTHGMITTSGVPVDNSTTSFMEFRKSELF